MERPATSLFLAVALACGPGCAKPKPPNLLIVTIDTLRADHVGSYGYAAAHTPALDALAARGWRFDRAATVVPLTLPAHSSLLTGTFPGHHGVRDNGGFYVSDEQVTLAETLRANGYRTGAFVASFVLDSRWGLGQGFDRYFDDFDLSKHANAVGMDDIQRPATEVVAQAIPWLSESSERPFFAWVHLYDPHTPYDPPEAQANRFPKTPVGAYDAEIAAADEAVGRLVAHLEQTKRLDRTLIVVLGDHGEMLGEHGEATHGFFVYDAAVRIPVIVAGPGVRPAVFADPVRIVDVMPTALALLGVDAPPDVQGADLRPLATGGRLGLLAHSETWFPRYHYGWSELRAIQDDRYKFIAAPRRELYDLRADPAETTNLVDRDPGVADRMEQGLRAFEARVNRTDAPAAPQSIDAETAERLEALGYIGSTVSARNLEDRPRGDPKDKIHLYNRLKSAAGASVAGRPQDAIGQVRTVLREDPQIVEGYTLLGNFETKLKRFGEAAKAYSHALRLDPEHQGALFSLASTYKEQGRLADARAGFERARSADPRNGRVLIQLADIAMRQKRFSEAEASLRDALDRKLDDPPFLVKLGECYIEMKRLADAEKVLRQAIDKRPTAAAAHFNLGLVYEGRGETEKAMTAYEAELRSNPKAYRASFNLGRLLLQLRRADAAAARLRETVSNAQEFGTGHLYLAKALLDLGDLSGAEASARRGLSLQMEPGTAPLGHFVLADVYSRQGRDKDAEREASIGRRLQRSG